MSTTTLPIVICGKNENVAAAVYAHMKSDYDVIYSGYSPPAALQEVPLILSGNPPNPSSLHTQIASNSFTRRPLAVIAGGGYDDEAFRALYDASLKACGGSKKDLGVLFLRVSNEITDSLVKEGKGPRIGTPEYPMAIVRRLKNRLRDFGIAPGLKGVVEEEVIGEVVRF